MDLCYIFEASDISFVIRKRVMYKDYIYIYEEVVKSSRLNQEENQLKLSNIHTIQHIHPAFQHLTYCFSNFFNLPLQNLMDIFKRSFLSWLGWKLFSTTLCVCVCSQAVCLIVICIENLNSRWICWLIDWF